MSLPLTTARNLDDHLAALGVRTGSHLAVHSALMAFGRIDGGVAAVCDALLRAVGKTGTVVVPTYTLQRGTIYDPRTTPSQNVGVLSEHVRQLPGAVRSACPMHNHAGIGAKARVLLESDGTVSFGEGSDFEALDRAGFDLLLLGAGLSEGASFTHHVEALANVPYRRWYDLERQCVTLDGALVTTICRYYGRPDNAYVENFEVLEEPLLEARAMRCVAAPLGKSRLVSLCDYRQANFAALARDPYGLVRRNDIARCC